MNPLKSCLVPRIAALSAAGGLALALSGCLGVLDVDSGGDPLVITENGRAAAPSAGRAVAVAEMRAQAAAAAVPPPVGARPGEQLRALAAREEPRSLSDAQAIEAELRLIAERRSVAANAAEISVLEARARELRRLAAAQAGLLRP